MSHVRAAARAEIARARRVRALAGPSPGELRRLEALLERCPELGPATERVLTAPRDSPEYDAAVCEVLAILCGGELDEPAPLPVLEPAPPVAAPTPERPAADRPSDLVQAIAVALQTEVALSQASPAPQPVECRRLLGQLARALAEHAPGAVAPDRAADDAIGPRHAAWRADHPAAAAGLDRLWRHDPHTAAWAAAAAELVERLTAAH